jgi:hypothetical protein
VEARGRSLAASPPFPVVLAVSLLSFFHLQPELYEPSSISGPFNWHVLQSPIDHFFAQGGRVLFYRISGREFMFRSSVGVDLTSNVVIQAQNAFVVQIHDSHELSPIRDYLPFSFQARRDPAAGVQ